MHKQASISIENLSAKELFDLANKKLQMEQSEARRVEAQAQVSELARKREQLLRTHEQALIDLDRELKALQQQRDQLMAAQRDEIAGMDRALAEARRIASGPGAAAPKESAPATLPRVAPDPEPEQPAEAAATTSRAPSEEDFTMAIVDAMRGRNDISDSLLREKLRIKGFPLTNLSRVLDKMIRDGIVSNKGGGNFALRRRP